MIIDFMFKHVYVRKKQFTCHFLGPPNRSGKGRLAADQLLDRGSGCDFLRSKSWPQLEAEIPDILQLDFLVFSHGLCGILPYVGIPIEPGWYDWRFEHHLPSHNECFTVFFWVGGLKTHLTNGTSTKGCSNPGFKGSASKVHCTVAPRAAFAHHWASIAHGHGSIPSLVQ